MSTQQVKQAKKPHAKWSEDCYVTPFDTLCIKLTAKGENKLAWADLVDKVNGIDPRLGKLTMSAAKLKKTVLIKAFKEKDSKNCRSSGIAENYGRADRAIQRYLVLEKFINDRQDIYNLPVDDAISKIGFLRKTLDEVTDRSSDNRIASSLEAIAASSQRMEMLLEATRSDIQGIREDINSLAGTLRESTASNSGSSGARVYLCRILTSVNISFIPPT